MRDDSRVTVTRMFLPDTVLELARVQHGAVTTRQLLRAGLTHGRIHNLQAAGFLHRLHQGVYAVGHVAPSDARRCSAAVLALSPDGALTGHSAGRLLGTSRRRFDRTQVLVRGDRRRRRGMDIIKHHRFEPTDTFRHNDIQVANLGWILLTMAADSSVGELTRTLREHSFHFGVDIDGMQQFLDEMEGTPDIGRVREACDALLRRDGGTDSSFEDRFKDELHARFPDVAWTSNFRVTMPDGAIRRLDFYAAEHLLCVEADPEQHDFVVDHLADVRNDMALAVAYCIRTVRVRRDAFESDPATALMPISAYLAQPTLLPIGARNVGGGLTMQKLAPLTPRFSP
jgi:hypothetical protein